MTIVLKVNIHRGQLKKFNNNHKQDQIKRKFLIYQNYRERSKKKEEKTIEMINMQEKEMMNKGNNNIEKIWNYKTMKMMRNKKKRSVKILLMLRVN